MLTHAFSADSLSHSLWHFAYRSSDAAAAPASAAAAKRARAHKVSPGWDFRESAKFPAPGFEFPARDQIRLQNSLQDCVGNSAKRPCNISALAIHLSPDLVQIRENSRYYGATATSSLRDRIDRPVCRSIAAAFPAPMRCSKP